MAEVREWRDIAAEESAIVTAIVSTTAIPEGQALVDQLEGAVVTQSAQWILDVRVSDGRRRSRLTDGPFPARAYVPSSTAYQGEIIIWIKDGQLNGLEYAWVTDEPPAQWPAPAEMEVVPERKAGDRSGGAEREAGPA